MFKMKPEYPTKQVVYVRLDLIQPTNSRIDQKTVDYLKQYFDRRAFGALPGWHDESIHKIVITDGNHRLQAVKDMGWRVVPVILLTKAEFDEVAYSDKTMMFNCYEPENPSIISKL